jgi:putative DNA primase/helicase
VTLAQPNGPTQAQLIEAAESWLNGGCSVIPIRADGTKRPLFEWKRFQTERATPEALRLWVEGNPGIGIGVVCGEVSGNLELFELESRAVDEVSMAKIEAAIPEGHPAYEMWDLINGDDGFCETTPSGGLHYLYRVSDHSVPGNTKIARRPATVAELEVSPDDKVKVLAETRGEGGYVVVAPSGGRVHNRRVAWQLAGNSDFGRIPTVTWGQRCALHAAIASALDQMPETPDYAPPARPQTVDSGERPGDVFNARADWRDILEPHGWRIAFQRGSETFWVRPGKDPRDGHSATTNYSGDGEDRLYVFSSSTEFDTEVPYTKFGAHVLLNYGGDFTRATRALRASGYGGPVVQRSSDDWSQRWDTSFGSTPIPTLKPSGIRDYTTTGACVRFVEEHGEYLKYVDESKIWRVWDGAKWADDRGASQVMQRFERMTEVMYDEARNMPDDEPMKKPYQRHVTRLRESGRTSIMSILQSKLVCSADDFDTDVRYLNLRNGIWDTVENKLIQHNPKYMLTKMMGVSYNPDAYASGTVAFLSTLIPDDATREYVLRALAYTMTGEADQRAFFLLQGPPGTGKTQFIEMMQQIFGDYGVTAMPSTFHKRPASGSPTVDQHALRGARFVTTSETSQDSQLDEELLKRYTGKDKMSTRALWGKPEEWVPTGTIWFATNHLPKFSSDEEAVWRRVKTIHFNTQFTDDGVDGPQSTPNIGRKLAALEGDGIFNLLIAALALYRFDGRLVEPSVVKQAVEEHKREVDPTCQMWDEKVSDGVFVRDPSGQLDSTGLYTVYEKWCAENGIRYPMGKRRFLNSIRQVIGYDQMIKSHGKTYIPGWRQDLRTGIFGTFGGREHDRSDE